jgi:hypothetical protein
MPAAARGRRGGRRPPSLARDTHTRRARRRSVGMDRGRMCGSAELGRALAFVDPAPPSEAVSTSSRLVSRNWPRRREERLQMGPVPCRSSWSSRPLIGLRLCVGIPSRRLPPPLATQKHLALCCDGLLFRSRDVRAVSDASSLSGCASSCHQDPYSCGIQPERENGQSDTQRPKASRAQPPPHTLAPSAGRKEWDIAC